MKRIILILLFFSNVSYAALDITCSPLSLGTFLLEEGLVSATDAGSARIGMTEYIGQESDCQITGDSETSVTVTINNNSSAIALSGTAGSFNANVRIEDLSDTDLGTNNAFSIPSGQTSKDFKIDASVPSGQSNNSGGEFSANIIIDVSYN